MRSTFTAAPNDPFTATVTDTTTSDGLSMSTTFDAASRSIVTRSPMNRAIEQYFDAAGRVREVRWPGLAAVMTEYDLRGRTRTITQGDRAYTLTWNDLDQLESVTDPTGRSISYEYDAAGRVKTQTSIDGRSIAYTYDAAGNVLSLTPSGRPAHVFTYDAVGSTDRYSAPGGATTQFVYNRDRLLTEIQRPGDLDIGLSYDRGRLLRMTGGGRTVGFDYHGGGQLQAISDSDGPSVTFGFDGPIPTSMNWTGEVSGAVSWTYDNSLRLSEESVNGNSVTYGYDDDSLVTAAGAQSIRRYPTSGAISGTTLGVLVDSYTYNAFGEMQRYAVVQGGATVFSIDYVRDKVGRITTKTENRFGFRVVHTYEYDASGRLETVKRDGLVHAVYGYDSNNNRQTHTTSAGVTSATYDDEDRLLTYGAAAYTYSPAGHLSTMTDSGGTTTYDYDAFGNLRSVTRPGFPAIEYVVDGADRRVAKKVGGLIVRRWLYRNALGIVAEIGPDGAMTRFVYSTRSNVPDYMIRDGVTYRFLLDHLGSVRYVLDSSTGTIMQSIDYDEFGRVVFDSNPGYQPFGFAGGLYDPDTGLVRFGARDYDPHTGRFTTKDPIGFAGGDTNLYAYVLNDPINLIDPMGTDWVDTAASFSAGLGDALLLGFGDDLREWTDMQFGWEGGALVDKCSGAYSAGEWAGIAAGTIAGGVAGAGSRGLSMGMSRANAAFPRGIEWVERSHWIAKFKNTPLDGAWNLQKMWGTDHALADPARYRLMRRWWKAANPLPGPLSRQMARIPDWAKGSGGGAAHGGTGAAMSGGGCGCN